jgi:alpha-glucuronidase
MLAQNFPRPLRIGKQIRISHRILKLAKAAAILGDEGRVVHGVDARSKEIRDIAARVEKKIRKMATSVRNFSLHHSPKIDVLPSMNRASG